MHRFFDKLILFEYVMHATLRKGRVINDYQTSKLVGDYFVEDAEKDLENKLYKKASTDYRSAAKSYNAALESLEPSSHEERIYQHKLERLAKNAIISGKKAHRMAALYRATEKTIPPIRRLLRRIKGRHVLSLFIFSLLFLVPNITGRVIGLKSSLFSIFGVIFFFLGIFLAYFLVKKHILINQFLK